MFQAIGIVVVGAIVSVNLVITELEQKKGPKYSWAHQRVGRMVITNFTAHEIPEDVGTAKGVSKEIARLFDGGRRIQFKDGTIMQMPNGQTLNGVVDGGEITGLQQRGDDGRLRLLLKNGRLLEEPPQQ